MTLLEFLIDKRSEGAELMNGGASSSSQLITDCEREILNTVNWDFEAYPTFYSIMEIFRSQGVLFSSDRLSTADAPTSHTLLLVDRYLDLFSLLILQDATLLPNVNPYLLTCAAIAASRRSNGVTQQLSDWPPELEKLSGLQSMHF